MEPTNRSVYLEVFEYEKALRAQIAALDRSLKLRKISEDEYFEELKKKLEENVNTESELYFQQLSRYENYQSKKLKNQEKASEESRKAAEKAAKEQQAIFKKSVDEKIAAVKEQQTLDDDFTKEMMYDEMENIISGLDKNSELYKKYNSEILKGRKSLADQQKKLDEKAFEAQKKEVGKGLDEILKEYQKAFDQLEKKQNSYRGKLMSVGGDIFSVETKKDENGNDLTTYTVNDIEKQLRAMREYHAAVKKLKDEGASEALLSELTSLKTDDSKQFAKYLSRMSEKEFARINELYTEKQQLADELSADLYKPEAQAISDSISDALDGLAVSAADYGTKAADSFADAFASEFADRAEKFAELFNNGNFAAEIKAAVESESARYSAAAYSAPAVSAASGNSSGTSGKYDLDAVLEKLNKPVQILLDSKIIAESVISYQNKYKRQTGG